MKGDVYIDEPKTAGKQKELFGRARKEGRTGLQEQRDTF